MSKSGKFARIIISGQFALILYNHITIFNKQLNFKNNYNKKYGI